MKKPKQARIMKVMETHEWEFVASWIALIKKGVMAVPMFWKLVRRPYAVPVACCSMRSGIIPHMTTL